MTYPLLKFLHLLGLTLMGAGLIGVWYADLRSRQVRELLLIAEGVRSIAVLYDGLVVPGALLLLGSEGNTLTRLYFLRLRRLSREALALNTMTPALAAARREHVPTFTHFLDIPLLFVIVALGAARPDTWMVFAVGTVLAVLVATGLTIAVPRLYPSPSAERSAQ